MYLYIDCFSICIPILARERYWPQPCQSHSDSCGEEWFLHIASRCTPNSYNSPGTISQKGWCWSHVVNPNIICIYLSLWLRVAFNTSWSRRVLQHAVWPLASRGTEMRMGIKNAEILVRSKWEVGIWSFRCLMLLGLIIIPDQWIFSCVSIRHWVL